MKVNTSDFTKIGVSEMNLKEIRWKQRYENLSKAFLRLEEAIGAFDTLSDLEKEGLIQRFEYTFELSWNTLKDYLEAQGVEAVFPREVIKSAFAAGILGDGEAWMEMLEQRNLMAHTYNEQRFLKALERILGVYYPELQMLMRYFEDRL